MHNGYSIIVFFLVLAACSAQEKDNKPKDPIEVVEGIREQRDVYVPLVRSQLDGYGLAVMGDSVGDSALFSCLARVGGAASFDPGILLRSSGQPIRHPDISPEISDTPTSKDMVNGILWCLYDLYRKGESGRALELVSKLISFGKDNRTTVGIDIGWRFCTNADRDEYRISSTGWAGKCFMPPSVVKDIYRVAKMVGYPCDADCQYFMAVGPNLPEDGSGFRRHLAVLTTSRNGFVEGGINDNSLREVLQKAAASQPRNALYQAAYHTFGDGDQVPSFHALQDESLFPKDRLPTKENYCTEYLFQRDEDQSDWVPCPPGDTTPDRGRGIEWVFAAGYALGEYD